MMGQFIMESQTQTAGKSHVIMKTAEKHIRMIHAHVEVVRNSKNVVDVIVHKDFLCRFPAIRHFSNLLYCNQRLN